MVAKASVCRSIQELSQRMGCTVLIKDVYFVVGSVFSEELLVATVFHKLSVVHSHSLL